MFCSKPYNLTFLAQCVAIAGQFNFQRREPVEREDDCTDGNAPSRIADPTMKASSSPGPVGLGFRATIDH